MSFNDDHFLINICLFYADFSSPTICMMKDSNIYLIRYIVWTWPFDRKAKVSFTFKFIVSKSNLYFHVNDSCDVRYS